MLNKLKEWVVDSWKTTATGFIAFGSILISQYGIQLSEAAQQKAIGFITAGGLLLIGIFSKDGDKKRDSSNSKSTGYYAPVIVCLFALSFAAIGVSCKKPTQQSGEDAKAYKKRLSAIYTAQIATGLDGMSEVVNVLAESDVLTAPTASTLLQINTKSADTWVILKDRLKNGFTDNATIGKIQEIVADVERLEAEGVLGIKNDDAKRKFKLVTGGFKTTLTALKNILIAVNGPAFQTSIEQSQKQITDTVKITERGLTTTVSESENPAWIFDLSNVVLNCFGRAAQQSWLPTEAVAYADGELIIAALKTKNAERMALWK